MDKQFGPHSHWIDSILFDLCNNKKIQKVTETALAKDDNDVVFLVGVILHVFIRSQYIDIPN